MLEMIRHTKTRANINHGNKLYIFCHILGNKKNPNWLLDRVAMKVLVLQHGDSHGHTDTASETILDLNSVDDDMRCR